MAYSDNADEFRVSTRGHEPVSDTDDEGLSDRPPPGARGKDTKKIIVLVALLAIGTGVVAFQFLRGRSPKAATGTPTAPSAAGRTEISSSEIESILARIERTEKGSGSQDLSVARVEQLVNEFGSYARDRQVPLNGLKENPFVVQLRKKPQAVLAAAATAPPRPEVTEEQRQAAREQEIRNAAAGLKLGSILVSGTKRLAVIGGRVYGVGDIVEQFEIGRIDADGVVLLRDGVTVGLDLFEANKGSH
jgi:hypothetical protein